jgi:hypothetical protein
LPFVVTFWLSRGALMVTLLLLFNARFCDDLFKFLLLRLRHFVVVHFSTTVILLLANLFFFKVADFGVVDLLCMLSRVLTQFCL